LLHTDATSGQTIKLGSENASFAIYEPLVNAAHCYITNNMYLTYQFFSSTGDGIIKVGLQQVR
jgi:hypothetical protein